MNALMFNNWKANIFSTFWIWKNWKTFPKETKLLLIEVDLIKWWWRKSFSKSSTFNLMSLITRFAYLNLNAPCFSSLTFSLVAPLFQSFFFACVRVAKSHFVALRSSKLVNSNIATLLCWMKLQEWRFNLLSTFASSFVTSLIDSQKDQIVSNEVKAGVTSF